MISSSIRDATAQQQTSTAVSSELVVPGPTPSFPPHLPTKTISSIRNGEYIDFNYLLSENIDGHDEHLKISFDALGSGFSIPVSMSQHKRQRIDSIERWLNAFNIFAHVLVWPGMPTTSLSVKRQRTMLQFLGLTVILNFILRNSLGWQKRRAMSAVALIILLMRVPLHLPDRCNDPQRTDVAITTARSPASPTPAHSSTAVTDRDVPATIQHSNTMQELQSRAVTNETANSYLQHLQPVTSVNVACLKHELQNHPSALFVSNLLKGFRDGFSIGFEGPRTPRFSRNLKSANEHPDLVTKNLLSEVKLGRTAGPFLSPPFPNFQIYPISVVPKKHSSDWRTIFHLSHPKASGISVNDYISKENYSLQYVKLDDAINLIIQLGRGSYMAKTDICSAFRNIPVHPSD